MMYGVDAVGDIERDFQATLAQCRRMTVEDCRRDKLGRRMLGWRVLAPETVRHKDGKALGPGGPRRHLAQGQVEDRIVQGPPVRRSAPGRVGVPGVPPLRVRGHDVRRGRGGGH